MYTREGKLPASRFGCWWLGSDNCKEQHLLLARDPGAQQSLKEGPGCDRREGKEASGPP